MRRPTTRLAALALVAALAAAPGRADAQTITLNAIDSGSYESTGFHLATNQNYLAGEIPGQIELRNFFVFQLPTLAPGEVIVSATLRLENPPGGFTSLQDLVETYNVRDVTFSVAQLTAGHAVGDPEGQAIFADLGTGTLYGTRNYTAADNGTVTEIALNAAAVADLNARLGTAFAFGGSVSTITPGGFFEFIFANTSSASTRQLVLVTAGGPAVIPEPGSVVLAGLGLAGLLGYGWRRKAAPV